VCCHRCKREGIEIISELVRLTLLPNFFRTNSAAVAVVDSVRAAMCGAIWIGTAKATDRLVLFALTEIGERCLKEEFGASVREVALLARQNPVTVWRSLNRLATAGWLERIACARDERAAIWRLKVPEEAADRGATISHAGERRIGLLQSDPSHRGDRADSSHSVIPFSHDAFRWGKGLGAVKGQIYELLKMPLTASEVAELLGYKYPRSARVHLQKLIQHGLVQRGEDGRYERAEADLDVVAEHLGTLGATVAQHERYRRERASWQAWWRAYEHWKRTEEIIDPETGVLLESGNRLHKRATMADFQRQVLSGRMLNADAVPRVEHFPPPPNVPNLNLEIVLPSEPAAQREPFCLGGELDPALAAAVARVQQTFSSAFGRGQESETIDPLVFHACVTR